MDEVRKAPTAAERRRLREERRRAARRRGHLRLAVAILTLLVAGTAVCWSVSAVRSMLKGPAVRRAAASDDASVAPGSAASGPASQISGENDLQPLASAKGVMAPLTVSLLKRLAPGPINTKYQGVTMFRGNATRTYYGEGPVPKKPKIVWTYPKKGVMQAMSSVAGETKSWAGTGWTGQPVVAEREGKTEIIFGAYDKKIHFLDGVTGDRIRPDFKTGDIIKGSVTLDPDGFPLLYSGSRDDYFHVVALDREEPTELWRLSANVPNAVWNNDWDGNGLIHKGFLLIGGENSHFFVVKLNRGYDRRGKVTVKPEVVVDFEGFTQELFEALGDREVSIENSPALFRDTVYFSNSGGLVWGLDIGGVLKGAKAPEVKLKWWAGDDTDASIVIDDEGMLYVCSELQRFKERARQNGQIMKLNPNKPADPLVWSIKVPPQGNNDGLGGCWATPALHGDMLYEPTHPGSLLGIDRRTGKVIWEKDFAWHAWGSPSVVDDVLIVPDTYGKIHAYDVSNPKVNPPKLWSVSIPTGAAIESTPVLWKGRIYVGARDGKFYCFAD